ncbi:MAG: hypothetical protein K8T89_24160, partial [Planctomycetes bacterium]|nr:hypothetical protein [Planctomycetota bacterium]
MECPDWFELANGLSHHLQKTRRALTEEKGAIARLNEELTKLPGIGPKSAERITHFLLTGDRGDARSLAEALMTIVEKVHPCRDCFNLTETELCSICSHS